MSFKSDSISFAFIVFVFVKRTFGTESMVAMVLDMHLACSCSAPDEHRKLWKVFFKAKTDNLFSVTSSPLSFVMNSFCMQ